MNEDQMTDDLPTAMIEGELTICGVTLRTYVLDDGRRILNADDVHRLFASWADGTEMTEAEAMAFARVVRGQAP